MKLVLLNDKKQPVTTTLIISEKTENEHSSVFKLVKSYVDDLSEFGVVRFEIRKPTGKKGGRPLEFAYLNEQQTMLIMTYMRNSPIIRTFKKKLVKEFGRMRDTIGNITIRQQNQEWQELRKTGKLSRKKQTDIIKVFIRYAVEQGSEGYKKESRIYANFTQMENKALFLLQEKFNNIRQILTGQQLQVLSAADQIVENALKEGMEKEMHYKDIWEMAKQRVETFATLMPKTPVPMIEQLEVDKNEK